MAGIHKDFLPFSFQFQKLFVTLEFLGIWETLHNPNFNPLEFEGFRKEAGLNAFTLSPTRWIEATNAIGIVSQAGRYGGTFAKLYAKYIWLISIIHDAGKISFEDIARKWDNAYIH